ncbi:MAG: VWA domain-containing protein [bacterium]|nr:VWA domain-containing protein [bacterium]
MATRSVNPIGLSFLDAMTCGLGAVILLFMIINGSVRHQKTTVTSDLQGEVDRLESEVLEGHRNLVELRNTVTETDEERALTQGLARRMIETLKEIRVELATYEASTLSRREHINQLQADLRSLEEDARRLSASLPSQETPGDRVRSYIGDGDRQYLTGLKVGGKRILFLVDASASMLGSTLVNVIRRRNLPDSEKVRAAKWQQNLATVDWLTTQIPRDSRFQIYSFNTEVSPVLPDTRGHWLDGGDREIMDGAVQALRAVVPSKGTSLYQALSVASQLNPRPDNIILLTDGLPTVGHRPARSTTVSPKQRVRLFERAVERLPSGIPVNVILFPMEGDPMAASSFWKVAMLSHGSFMSISQDWP